jgi:streptothricin acetyltransferase
MKPMPEPIEIIPLKTLNLDDIWPIITGYESDEKYAIEKSESESQTIFNIHLIKLKTPYQATYNEDFNNEDVRRYLDFLPQGYSFGAFKGQRMIAFAISEGIPWNRSLRIWEFHVMREFRRQGIGRKLMNHVVEKARQDKFRIVWLETQNTNVNAIRFYRQVGFKLDALDLSFYTNHDVTDGEVAFFMKKKLEN